MDETQLTAGVAGGAIVAFVTLLLKHGWPAVKEWWGLQSDREKVIAAQAKEGPAMVIVRLEMELKEVRERTDRDLAEQRQRFNEVLGELKSLQKDHSNCQIEQAELRAMIQLQDMEIKELKGEIEDQRTEITELKAGK